MSENNASAKGMGFYQDYLKDLGDAELEREKIEEINRMLAANVALFQARQNPSDEKRLAEAQAETHEATASAQAVLNEINRRAENEQRAAEEIERESETDATDDEPDMGKWLHQARIQALQDWLDKAGGLTELLRTAMSISLHLASMLPTEATYNPETWGYPAIQQVAQDAEQQMVDARKRALQAVSEVQGAMRVVNRMKAMEENSHHAEPDDDDGIPF